MSNKAWDLISYNQSALNVVEAKAIDGPLKETWKEEYCPVCGAETNGPKSEYCPACGAEINGSERERLDW
jgi:rubrerythrin